MKNCNYLTLHIQNAEPVFWYWQHHQKHCQINPVCIFQLWSWQKNCLEYCRSIFDRMFVLASVSHLPLCLIQNRKGRSLFLCCPWSLEYQTKFWEGFLLFLMTAFSSFLLALHNLNQDCHYANQVWLWNAIVWNNVVSSFYTSQKNFSTKIHLKFCRKLMFLFVMTYYLLVIKIMILIILAKFCRLIRESYTLTM